MTLIPVKQRRGTAAAWTAANPILEDGQLGFETDTRQFKLGNGANSWNALPYVTPDTLTTVLTGITVLTGSITAADTIFTAFRKIMNFMATVIPATVGEMATGTDLVKYVTPKVLADYAVEWATTDSDIIAAITGATYDPANNNIANITPANSKVFKYSQIYVGGGQFYYATSDNQVLLVGKRNVLKQFTGIANGTATVTFTHGLPDITAATPFIPSFPAGTPAIVSYSINTTHITIVHAATIANLTNVVYNINIALL